METAILKRPGDPQSQGTTRVCIDCNNGWMSRLQQAAKPVLLPLIQGDPTRLSRQNQRLVARWATMSVMTSDFIDPNKQAVPIEDRRQFSKTGEPPADTWKIWIGRFQRQEWRGYWVHNSIPIGDNEEELGVTEEGHPHPNTQTTTLVFGELYVHAFSCPYPEIVRPVELSDRATSVLTQIWPVQHENVTWPSGMMSDRDADTMAGEIFAHLDYIWRTTQGWEDPPPFEYSGS